LSLSSLLAGAKLLECENGGSKILVGLATNWCAKMKGGLFLDNVGMTLGLAFEELGVLG